MRILMVFGAALLLVIAPVALHAGDTFTWDGSEQPVLDWSTWQNWSGGSANDYPGRDADDDVVIIPNNLNSNRYPCTFDLAGATIKRLVIAGKSGAVDLLFLNDNSAHVLIIDTVHTTPLDPGEFAIEFGSSDADIKLQRKSELWFADDDASGPEVAVVTGEGTIEFSHDSQSDRPKLVIGDGGVLTLFGGAFLKGTDDGGIITGEVGSPDAAEVLVLGYSSTQAVIKGSFEIDPIVYNHGVICTSSNGPGEGEDPDDFAPGKITLACHAKAGTGTLEVNGGNSQTKSELILNAPYAGSGPVIVRSYGILRVNRHLATLNGGELEVRRGGQIRVKKGVLFELSRFEKNDCPVVREEP